MAVDYHQVFTLGKCLKPDLRDKFDLNCSAGSAFRSPVLMIISAAKCASEQTGGKAPHPDIA